MADFPRKHLVYVPKSITGDVSEAIDEFDAALAARRGSIKNTGVFLPNMSAITGPTICKVVVNDGSATTSLTVYKVNRPGFFYYQHWKGMWDPSGWFQVLVCKDNKFASGVYEYINTKDTSSGSGSGGNDHSNMIPFNPGSNTFIIVRGTVNNGKKTLYYIPAWTGESDKGSSDALVIQENKISLTAPVVSGVANDDGFKACFA